MSTLHISKDDAASWELLRKDASTMNAPRIAELTEQKTALIAYLHSKLKAADWHAVQDAASDIRELEAVLKELTRV